MPFTQVGHGNMQVIGPDGRARVSDVCQVLLEGDRLANLHLRRVLRQVQVVAEFQRCLLDRNEIDGPTRSGVLFDKINDTRRGGIEGLTVRCRLRLVGEYQVQAKGGVALMAAPWIIVSLNYGEGQPWREGKVGKAGQTQRKEGCICGVVAIRRYLDDIGRRGKRQGAR